MSAALPLALAALLPVLIGPLPSQADTGPTITAQLCNGGTITIPLGDGEPPVGDGACYPKACHAGNCRGKPGVERAKRPI